MYVVLHRDIIEQAFSQSVYRSFGSLLGMLSNLRHLPVGWGGIGGREGLGACLYWPRPAGGSASGDRRLQDCPSPQPCLLCQLVTVSMGWKEDGDCPPPPQPSLLGSWVSWARPKWWEGGTSPVLCPGAEGRDKGFLQSCMGCGQNRLKLTLLRNLYTGP